MERKLQQLTFSFDLFHLGHMRMLAAAKKKGDILVVAVKSDRAAALKKEDPPVLDQEIRMETANCISADYVVMADYDPLRLVPFEFKNTQSFEWMNMFVPVFEALRPDVFIHEDNYSIRDARKELFEAYNIKGVIQPRTEGISTTEIIDKIKTRLLLKMQKETKI